MAIWEKNGHIIEDQNGHPIECAWCPCGDMTCDDIIAQQIAVCEQAGAYYLHQTGFLYSLTDPSAEVIPSIFHWIEWEYDAGRLIYVCHLKYLDCDCEKVTLATAEFAAPPATIDLFGYAILPNSSACAGGCEEQIATLIAQAVASGWTLYGEGVMVRKTSANYPCYRFDMTKIPVMICADTGSSFIYIGCTCYRSDITGDSYQLFRHLHYSGCDCLDVRELILTYPDVFGVDDVSFGDDTVYTSDKSQSGGYVYTESCLERSHSYDTWFCNYCNMYVIFDNSCIGMPNDEYESGAGSYIPDYFLMEFDTNGRWLGGNSRPLRYVSVTNGTLTFDGKIQPFTTAEFNKEIWPHSDLMTWKGLTIRWVARNSNAYWRQDGYVDSYSNQSDAQQMLDDYNSAPNKYGSNSFEADCNTQIYFYEPKASVTPPSFSPTHVEGRVEYNQDTGMWDVYAPHDEFGSDGTVYNLNFTETNKGFIINGQSGFHDTLDVYGFLDSLPNWTTPPSEQTIINKYQNALTRCFDSEQGMESMCPEGSEKIVGRNGAFKAVMSIPMYDMSFVIMPDDSMGGCMDAEWWKAIMEEAESSESSEE